MSGPRWIPTMLLITAFQLISFAQVIFVEDGINYFAATILAIYLLIEWGWSITSSFVLRKSSPAIEFVAFFLTGIGLAVVATKGTSTLFTQFLAVVIGFALYIALLWMLANVDRVEKFHMPMEIIAIGLLAIGLIFASNRNGAYNWVQIGGFSFQPSEIVKIAFIFVGAATLEKIQTTKHITRYAIFAVICIGLLFLMRDLGTALIFFFTFVVLGFMRSGDVRTILFVILAAGMAAVLVVLIKRNYVMNRFGSARANCAMSSRRSKTSSLASSPRSGAFSSRSSWPSPTSSSLSTVSATPRAPAAHSTPSPLWRRVLCSSSRRPSTSSASRTFCP